MHLHVLLESHCGKLPREQRAAFMIKGWSKLKAHFGCTYRKIPETCFVEALGIVARHCAEYHPITRIAKGAQPASILNPFDAQALQAAAQACYKWAGVGNGTPQDFPSFPTTNEDVLAGVVANAIQEHRFVIDFNTALGKDWRKSIQVISREAPPIDYSAIDAATLARNMPLHRLPAIIAALSQRVAKALPAPAA